MTSKPAHKAVRVELDQGPFLEAFRCRDCGGVTDEKTLACRSCASRTPLEAFRSAETGSLWSWSVVHRSYPGVKVPFVSAIVDMDDGLTLKGTVLTSDPSALRQGQRLHVAFDDAGGARTDDGMDYVGFHFVPVGEDQ